MKKILSAIFCLGIIFVIGSSVCAKPAKDAQYYFNQGADYERKNNRLGATEPYSKALEIDPEFDDARIARSQIYYFYGKYEKALEDYKYFYNKTPKFGPGAFYENRINCKKNLGLYEDAMDDMFEVILIYGGQAKVLKEMLILANQHPELKDKLSPKAHEALIEKYKAKAKSIRDYAQMYKDKEGNVTNPEYYNFFINIAKAMDPDICLDVEYPTAGPRVAPDEGQVIDTELEIK